MTPLETRLRDKLLAIASAARDAESAQTISDKEAIRARAKLMEEIGSIGEVIRLTDLPQGCDRGDCKFTGVALSTTTLHSPISRDRHGVPVSGGGNTVTRALVCDTCGKRWISSATEIEDARGKRREWREI